MGCLNYNCAGTLDLHTPNDCGEELLGGSDAIIILECDHQLTDPSDGTAILAEIAAGRATLIEGVKVSIEAPAAVELEPLVACETAQVINYDRAGTLLDGNVSAVNINFYTPILRNRKFGGVILRLCGTTGSNQGEQVIWIDSTVKFKGGLIYPPGNNEQIRLEASFAWRNANEPDMYASPTGVFN